jgi:hypothetical protein
MIAGALGQEDIPMTTDVREVRLIPYSLSLIDEVADPGGIDVRRAGLDQVDH